MIGSKVYFTDMRISNFDDNLPKKLLRLIKAAGFEQMDLDKKFVAVKIHFGELGNLATIRAGYVRTVVEAVKAKGGMPYLTDCNTLYPGMRKNAIDHLAVARLNGYSYDTCGCDIVISDGIKGDDDVEVPFDGDYIKSAKIGHGIYDADVIISMSHFKCHEMAGFGGAIKNIGMGCGSRRGKMEQHCASKPEVDRGACRGCRSCTRSCGSNAITVENKKASIDQKKCTGCGMCIAACPFDAISAANDATGEQFSCRMAEYTAATLLGKPNFHISFITDVSPCCDCRGENDTPIVPNLGILASFDPVALDQACADLVNQQTPLPDSAACKAKKGEDLFTVVSPYTDWTITLDHSVKMGLGTRQYELVRVK